MPFRRSTLTALGAAAMLVAACSSSPPPAPSEPKPAPAPAAPPETAPTPPPKPCKALDEQCHADEATKAKVAGGALVFAPPKGWTYAQGDIATIAQGSDHGPAVALAQIEIGDAKQEGAKRDAALDALAKEIKVTLPKKKVTWKKPDDMKDVAGVKVGLWQTDGAARGDKKGPILIFSVPRGDGKIALGLGFVPDDDNSGADGSILQSIESIAVAGE